MSVRRTYVVGDLHGRMDLLRGMQRAIADHGEGKDLRIIFLGDYVDRGPQSREVVETMIALCEARRVICLKGNHEEMMHRALGDGVAADYRAWIGAGGGETLRSYGADSRETGRTLVPAAHLRWMAGLPLTSGDGHRVYVHAGLAPGVAFEQQQPEHCLWIREKFLRASAGEFEAHVVHGHTPQWEGKPHAAQPELLAHRTNLDSGAYETGALTAGVFDPEIAGGPLELLFVRAGGSEVTCERASAPRPAAPARRRPFWRMTR
jgi:serine/threonine protein phosphatase 1